MQSKEESFQDLENLMPEQPQKRRCCCWSSTPRAICCGIFVLLIILVAIGIILLLVNGVDTDFDVSAKTLQNEVVSFSTNELHIRLKLEISIYNPNTWNVDVSGGQVDYKYGDFKLGSQSVPSMRLEGGKRTTVEIDADVRVDKSQSGATDTFNSIVQRCSTSNEWSLDISGHVKASVRWLLGIDVNVPIASRQQQMTCPAMPTLAAGDVDLSQAFLSRLASTAP